MERETPRRGRRGGVGPAEGAGTRPGRLRWTRVVERWRWTILALAAAIAAASLAAGSHVADRLSSGGFEDPASESSVVERRLQERLGFDVDPGMVVLARARRDVRTPRVRAELERLSAAIQQESEVGAVLTHYAGPPGLVSQDGRSTYLVVNFRTKDLDRVGDASERIRERLGSGELRLSYGGYGPGFREGSDMATSDLRRAELLVFPVLALLLVFVFRGLVAALLPLVLAGFALVGTYAGLRVIDGLTDVSVYALNLAGPLSLGLSIDYSLFVVSRYREELARGRTSSQALQVTFATAGRTVAFSALTVAGAMTALLIFPQQFLYSLGVAGIFVALLAGAAALTVVPALLAILGPRVNSLSTRPPARHAIGSWWERLPRLVTRRPGLFAALALTIVLVVSLPAVGTAFTTFDTRVLPAGSEARQVHETIRTDFPAFHDSPSLVLVRGRAVGTPAGVERTRRRLGAVEGAAGAAALTRIGDDGFLFEVVSRHGPLAGESVRMVERIRGLGGSVAVTGQTAEFADARSSIGSHLPLALLVIVVATVPLLMTMTGSVVLPAIALLLNALTVLATFGFLVFVFQDGRFESLLGYESQGGIEINQSVLLLAVIFGVSTDYGVFLLARVKEFLDRGLDHRDATIQAVLRTGRLITAAALVVCVAVGALATSRLGFLKADGLGIAFAIAFDATVIRLLLIPSVLAILRGRAWTAPHVIERFHDRFKASTGPPPPRAIAETPVCSRR